MKVAVLGATGYTGMVLLRILNDHNEVAEIWPVSTSLTGESPEAFDPGLSGAAAEKYRACGGLFRSVREAAAAKPDVVFSALPHLASAEVCRPFFGKALVIDLSADFRIRSADGFLEAYGEDPPAPELQSRAVYGLPELYRSEIVRHDLIANPGCYPTATLLPLAPLLRRWEPEGTVIINALSGISGAGRKAKVSNLFCSRTENAGAYAPGRTHRHRVEIEQEVRCLSPGGRILFTPHLVPMKRGMAVTTVLALKTVPSDSEIDAAFREDYGNAPFVHWSAGTLPETGHVWGSNSCRIGWHREEGHVMLFSVIDNLMKGASGQAVQNMNIRLGLDETAGLSVQGSL